MKKSPSTPNFYPAQYQRFHSPLAAEIRAEIYGEDIGQQGWRSMDEQHEIIALVSNAPGFHMLDIACGSAGPSLAIAANTACHLTAIDIEPHAIDQAFQRAAELDITDRATFITADCGASLPLEDDSFDLITCIDALLHLGDRFARIRDWARLLKPGARLVLTDAAILTGPITKSEIDARAVQGAFAFAPPGINEMALAQAGLRLIDITDTTPEAAVIARRTHDVRETHRLALIETEGEDWFNARQHFLKITADLAARHVLSRFRYIAEKPG